MGKNFQREAKQEEHEKSVQDRATHGVIVWHGQKIAQFDVCIGVEQRKRETTANGTYFTQFLNGLCATLAAQEAVKTTIGRRLVDGFAQQSRACRRCPSSWLDREGAGLCDSMQQTEREKMSRSVRVPK